MPANLLMLGSVPQAAQLGSWLMFQLASKARPHFERFLQNPSAAIGRVGDVLVWNGGKGREVIATLEGLTDSQSRIERVVGQIEKAQIGIAGSLGTLTSLSMATLGVASFTAGFMVLRMNALHHRLNAIADQISDIQTHLHAQNQAYLHTSLDFLTRFERSGSSHDLHSALEASTYATRVYQHLVQMEVQGRRRLIALNQCGRYYLLALTVQVRCLILANELGAAEQRITVDKEVLTKLAQTTFAEAVGKAPEAYLDANLQADHVTLDLLTEVYQQANQLGVLTGVEQSTASQMFEHFRARINVNQGWFRPAGKAKAKLVRNLKYLMACLEDVSRVESLRLRIADVQAGKGTFQELEKAVAAAREQIPQPVEADSNGPVVAFAFA